MAGTLPALLERLRGTPRRLAGRRDPLGPKGERIAAKHLKKAGYRVVSRNLFTRAGEADLVCLTPDGRALVVVEVKARRWNGAPGEVNRFPPELAIDGRKRRKLLAVAGALSRRKRWMGMPVRIDVVAVEIPQRGAAVVRHHEGAVGKR